MTMTLPYVFIWNGLSIPLVLWEGLLHGWHEKLRASTSVAFQLEYSVCSSLAGIENLLSTTTISPNQPDDKHLRKGSLSRKN